MKTSKRIIPLEASRKREGMVQQFRILLAMRWYRRHLHEGVAAYCKEQGWALDSLDHSPDLQRSDLWEGIIILHQSEPQLKTFLHKGVPVVTLSMDGKGQMRKACVCQDQRAIGAMGARHLLERGFRTLGFCGYWDAISHQRFVGFREEAERQKAVAEEIRLPHRTPRAAGPDFIMRWLSAHLLEKTPPFGIMTAHDLLGITVMDACRLAGLRIPEQAAVIGVDNEEIICECAQTPLSSVDNNLYLQGYTAAQLLGQLMNGGAPPDEPVFIQPRRIAVRASSDTIAAEDPKIAKILQHMHEQMHDPEISVKSLSRRFGVSRGTLLNLFSKAGLRPPARVIKEIRLRQACYQLEHTNKAINEVAQQAGFSSTRSFCRFFRQMKAASPEEWRKTNTR